MAAGPDAPPGVAAQVVSEIDPEPTATGRPQVIAFLLIDDFALMSYAAAIEPLRAANLLSRRQR